MRTMRRILLASLVWLLGAPLASAQISEDEQRAACGGDVIRLCLIYITDRERISECMIAKRSELTPTCRAMVDATLAAKRKRPRG